MFEPRNDLNSGHRRTKIVATLGPASRSPENIRELIEAGVNVFRLNFSHGSHEEHLETYQRVRAASDELNVPIAVLQDLSGPKLRISQFEGEYGQLKDGDEIYLQQGKKTLSTTENIYCELVDPAKVLKPGHQVFLADGILALKAEEVSEGRVRCTVTKGGRIRSRVGIAFPDSDLELPATTDKDLHDLKWGIEHGVDYVAISFVNNAADILQLREEAKKSNAEIRVISKIERKGALKNIEEILDNSDGVMVARGDLGLELPLEQVPRIQKRLIEEANFRGIPAIVATQMLHSMIQSVRPTRAEVSDIATAVMSGADAVMLSEETAIGEHPALAVKTLSTIAREAEAEFDFQEYRPRLRDADKQTVPDAVAYAAAAAAVKVEAAAIVSCTETGTSARLLAKYRPQQAIYGASSQTVALRRMCLYWGIQPIHFEAPRDHAHEVDTALQAVQEHAKLPNGSLAVITAGFRVREPGSTRMIEIQEMTS